MLTEVRICGRKLFHPHMWRVKIDGKKWWYLEGPEMFVDEHGYVAGLKDMPMPVQLGFKDAWENNCFFSEKYSARHSYGWKLMLDKLQKEGYEVVVFSRGRRMGVTRMPRTKNPLTDIPIAPVLV